MASPSVSVKNRAKLFENLSGGNPDDNTGGGTHQSSLARSSPVARHSYGRNNNIIVGSPTVSGGNGADGGVVSTSPFMAANSPRTISNGSPRLPVANVPLRMGHSPNVVSSVGQRKSMEGNNAYNKGTINLPLQNRWEDDDDDEDGIPPPSFEQRRNSFANNGNTRKVNIDSSNQSYMKPVILPSSPFKARQSNGKDEGKVEFWKGSSMQSYANIGNVGTHSIVKQHEKTRDVEECDPSSETDENRIDNFQDRKKEAAVQQERRSERYLKAKQRSSSPAPTISNSPARAGGLVPASNALGSDGSKMSNSPVIGDVNRSNSVPTSDRQGPDENGGSRRGSRTLSNVSHQEARRALLNATVKKKEIVGSKLSSVSSTANLAERVGEKANRAVALKNANKKKNLANDSISHSYSESESTRSTDSAKVRRSKHPAMSGRKNVGAPSKLSGADLLTSFRQFNATRIESNKGKTTLNMSALTATIKTQSDPTTSIAQQKIDVDSQSLSSTGHSRDHETVEAEDSMHSMNETHYQQSFYHLDRVDVVTKQSFNDTYLSSLSSNTFSIQSLKSPGGTSSLPSPMSTKRHEYVRSSKLDPLLEPPQEHSSSTQTMKSEIGFIMSPGPSNRSAHSIANSIISSSPTARGATDRSQNFDVAQPIDPPEVVQETLDPVVEEMADDDTNGNVKKEETPVVEAPADGKDNEPDLERLLQNKEEPPCPVPLTEKEAILTVSSGRSNSPRGMIFNDSDDSDSFAVPAGPPAEGKIVGTSNEGEVDMTTGQGDAVLPPNTKHATQNPRPVEDPSSLNVSIKGKDTSTKQHGSSSTKETVSTSIRTGMSSIQNEVVEINGINIKAVEGPLEGSTSIRTGLSGLQSPRRHSSEMEHSGSLRMSMHDVPQSKSTSKHVKVGMVPETIAEDQSHPMAPDIVANVNSGKEESLFSGLQAVTTSTTEGSGKKAATNGAETLDDKPLSTLPPTLVKDGDQGVSRIDDETSFGTSPASRNSRPWKIKIGKRVNGAIKNVLAKASPRSSVSMTTPRETKQQESASLFSSVDDDDDDDIFDGLEDEDNTENPKEEKSNKSRPSSSGKGQRTDAKTPKQRNSKVAGKSNAPTRATTKGSSSKRLNKKEASGTSKDTRAGKRLSNKQGDKRQGKKNNKSASKIQNLTEGTVNEGSLYSNDRSGTIVDESEVLHVNSDITSSLLGGPISSPRFPPNSKKAKRTEDEIVIDNTEPDETPKLKSPMSRSKSSRKNKSNHSNSKAEGKISQRSGKRPVAEKAVIDPVEGKYKNDVEGESENAEETNEKPASMFMNISCGLAEHCSTGFARICTPGKKVEMTVDDADEETEKSLLSHSSHSRLTDLEKKVWSEWDRLNDSVVSKPNPKDNESVDATVKKEEHERKREAARDKLLDIASTAMNSHISVKSNKENDSDTRDAAATDPVLSASVSTESGGTKETGASGVTTTTASGESRSALSSHDSSHAYSSDYTSAAETDFVSTYDAPLTPSRRSRASDTAPMLISISQRSLMDKFTKQLTSVGVEVLKLNRRKQWQVRYFTVSRERIALSAHEALSNSGDMAHCPKALLWLKKFNPKSGGYGISNIDKNGHGGMHLVDLNGMQVHAGTENLLENPLPKKLHDKFKESALVTLDYKMSGVLRSIEFRCKNNDEAQFLCTCMRVIRDLLRRERSLRQKANRQKMAAAAPS